MVQDGGGFFGLGWLPDFPGDPSSAPGVLQIVSHGRWWLAVVVVFVVLCAVSRFISDHARRGALLARAGGLGLLFLAVQGLAIGFTGWSWTISETLFGALPDGQPSMGAGAVVVGLTFVILFPSGSPNAG